MFKNEGGTWDAGTSILPFALVFSLVVRQDKRLMFCQGSRGFGPLTFNKMGEVACAR